MTTFLRFFPCYGLGAFAVFILLNTLHYTTGRLQWPRGLRHEMSSPARTLGSWIRIPLKAWMFVCFYSVFVSVAPLRRADPSCKESTACLKLRNWSEMKRFTDALCCKSEQQNKDGWIYYYCELHRAVAVSQRGVSMPQFQLDNNNKVYIWLESSKLV
jgi:hypothetical protein